MKQFKFFALTALLAGAFAKPNQAAPKPAAPSQAAKSSRIGIIGKFQKPGLYNLSGQWRILDAIAVAGGMTANPDSLRLSVRRGSKILPVNLRGLLSLDLNQNLTLQPGDVIVAFDAHSVVEPTILTELFVSALQSAPKKPSEGQPFDFFPEARFKLLGENHTKQK